MCKFGRNPAICLREEAILGPVQKCPYHVTLTLSTTWMHAHLETILCNFGRNRAIFVVVEAICAKKFTNRQTHTGTDDRHHAIVLAHGMS